MARGADGEYFDDERLPGVLKLELLRGYLPVFLGRLGSRNVVEYLDGYAGVGRYGNGREGSPAIALRIAQDHQSSHGYKHRLRFFERDRGRYEQLEELVSEFATRGVDATATCDDVSHHIDFIVNSATSRPLFAFLDPCGVALPYKQIVALMNRPGGRSTEILLNFSMDAVRRIGGRLSDLEAAGAAKTLERLDRMLGGSEWRELLSVGPDRVVEAFAERLAHDVGAEVVITPVRRDPAHVPLYYLVFVTRWPDALLAFTTRLALAQAKYRERHMSSQAQLSLDFLTGTPLDTGNLEQLEARALPRVKLNITNLLGRKPWFRVGAEVRAILGDDFGVVRESVIRKAIKELHAEGVTSCTGVGKLERMDVARF